MTVRLFNDSATGLAPGPLALSESAARHAQVLRLQPGDPVIVFDGRGGQWAAAVQHMGRRDVTVDLQWFDPKERELSMPVTIAAGMPANDRFDWLVEKATELGAAAIQPLMCERSVLRVTAERAQRKRSHWQGVAIAAAEQCGRTRIPLIHEPLTLPAWLGNLKPCPDDAGQRWLLSPAATQRLRDTSPMTNGATRTHVFLSGPEGGLSPQEEALAMSSGFVPIQLGPRTLRAETAPLVALANMPDR